MKPTKLIELINDLREMEKKEPNETISKAISYLDVFLEKICTQELYFERTGWSTLRMNVIVPQDDEYGFLNGMALIKASFDCRIASALLNFEEAVGLEPVTIREFHRGFPDPYFVRNDEDLDKPATYHGYRLYKQAPNSGWMKMDLYRRYMEDDRFKEIIKTYLQESNDHE